MIRSGTGLGLPVPERKAMRSISVAGSRIPVTEG
jgi:hypothetical protein